MRHPYYLAFCLLAGCAEPEPAAPAIRPAALYDAAPAPTAEPQVVEEEPEQFDDGYDQDCDDFYSQQDAQDHYDADQDDPDGLDADYDGVPCESL